MIHHLKISDDEVYNIKEAIANGEKQASIAKRYGISKSYVSLIKNNHYRTNVEFEIDLTEHSNFWSTMAPNLSGKIVKLYQQGLSQAAVAQQINDYVETLDPNMRTRGKLNNPNGPARVFPNGDKEYWFDGIYQGKEIVGVFTPWHW